MVQVNLRQLEYVLWVAKERSFSRAALKLHVVQSAISKQIHALEDELGVVLFHRDGHGAIPTAAAQRLCDTATKVFAQLEDARADISNLKESPAGAVHLGVPPSLSQYFATSVHDTVKSRYPDICLKITEGWSGYLYEWIVNDYIDLGIIYSSQTTEDLFWQPLATEDVCVIEMAGRSDRSNYQLAQIARLPLVVPPRPHGLRLVIERAFAQSGLTPNIALEAEVWSILKDHVARGDVYGLLPPSEIREDIESGRLRAVPIAEPGIKRTLCIARHRSKPVTQAIDKIFALVTDEIKQRVREGLWKS